MRGVDALDIEGRIGLSVAEALASASTSAKSRPCRASGRMKLPVPLVMPPAILMRLAASPRGSP